MAAFSPIALVSYCFNITCCRCIHLDFSTSKILYGFGFSYYLKITSDNTFFYFSDSCSTGSCFFQPQMFALVRDLVKLGVSLLTVVCLWTSILLQNYCEVFKEFYLRFVIIFILCKAALWRML